MYRTLEQEIMDLWGSKGMEPVIDFHAKKGIGVWTITAPVKTEYQIDLKIQDEER